MPKIRTPEELAKLAAFLDSWVEERRSQNTFSIGVGLRDAAPTRAKTEARRAYDQLNEDLMKLRRAVEQGEF